MTMNIWGVITLVFAIIAAWFASTISPGSLSANIGWFIAGAAFSASIAFFAFRQKSPVVTE